MSKPKPGIEIVFLFCNVEALKTHRNHQLEWPCTPRTPRVENFGRPLGEVNGFQALFVLGFAKLETGWWFEPYPSEKYELKSVGIMTFPILYIFFFCQGLQRFLPYTFPIYGKIKHVPTHQPGDLLPSINPGDGLIPPFQDPFQTGFRNAYNLEAIYTYNLPTPPVLSV
jgi:hypothetical protein